MPKVSVIIPTYNRSQFVCETVESVLSQTYKDFEIIVIDDGSTDGTKDVLAHYSDQIKYIYQQNQGVGAARNKGITEARGEYLAFIDDDDLWLPEKLEKQVEYMDNHPDVAFVSTGTYVIDVDGNDVAKWQKYESSRQTFESLVEDNFIFNLTVLLRKNCFENVGGFDTRLAISQDYDLWLRLAKRYKFAYLDFYSAKYREHAQGISKNTDLRLKNRFAIFNKKELFGDLTRVQKRIRHAKIYYKFAGEYLKGREYHKTALMYVKSLLHFPLVGKFYWPKESLKMRFSLPYRILKVYILVIVYFIKGLLRLT